MNKTPLEIYENQQIISPDRYNGRINIIEPPSPDIRFKMQEKIAINNKSTEYREGPLDMESSMLSNAYFSAENIQIIQNGLRAGVYKMSDNKFIVAPQDIDTIKTIMQSIFQQYAEFSDDIKKEIKCLNKLVLDYAIPNVYNEAIGYMNYLRDQSTIATPLELPRQQDRDFKHLEQKKWV